eukprot:6387266-Amphidinium_carterae.1
MEPLDLTVLLCWSTKLRVDYGKLRKDSKSDPKLRKPQESSPSLSRKEKSSTSQRYKRMCVHTLHLEDMALPICILWGFGGEILTWFVSSSETGLMRKQNVQ